MAFDFIDWSKLDFFNLTNSTQTTCQQFEEIIYLIIDGEATPEDKEYFKAHVTACQKCLERFILDLEVKKLIKQKIRKKHVPSEVIISILEKI